MVPLLNWSIFMCTESLGGPFKSGKSSSSGTTKFSENGVSQRSHQSRSDVRKVVAAKSIDAPWEKLTMAGGREYLAPLGRWAGAGELLRRAGAKNSQCGGGPP